MLNKLIIKFFGEDGEKQVKKYTKEIDEIKIFEEKIKDFSLEDIKNKTEEFKKMFEGLNFEKKEDSIKIKKILDEIKFEAFAVVKQTCTLIFGKEFEIADGRKVTWEMIPYDVQLVGGLSLHDGNISEMKTGEGKTLVATLPSYLNALTGNSVQVVTVNDYLATRDSEEMGILYSALGLTTGVVTNDMNKQAKINAYKCDVVYATNNELGFDYLRDNMVIDAKDKVQSKLFFAVIDEVDSILIDEARTPLIISMPDNEPTSKYAKFAAMAKLLKSGEDYKLDEKQKTSTLTESGIKKLEGFLKVDNIYVSNHYNDLHHIENALKAESVYIKDKDYLVTSGEVLIIDEHTGRVLAGRRYSDGLHQAIEAKEGVEIQQESRTLASITFQNYFRMYWKLSGMTGTAKTEEEEFYKVYGLNTLVIPTNKPIARIDKKDLLFKNEKGKFEYVVGLIDEINKTGQPILVGTVSVDKSEYLSDKLTKAGIKHNVLNAKHHEREAEVVAAAGQKGSVTIATNMAGRGTDIKLGEGVADLGGLYIIGTEKHETRRIDNQLRGRAGRQGDAGTTQYLVSPNDDIMRIFGGDKLFSAFNSPVFASLPDNEPLVQSGMLTNRITGVQKQVEGHNFDTRKHVLQYDDVINKHREIIYARRNKILDAEDIEQDIKEMIVFQVGKIVNNNTNVSTGDMDSRKIIKDVNDFLGVDAIDDKIELDDVSGTDNSKKLTEYISEIVYDELEKIKTRAPSEEDFYNIERRIVLSSIDELWMRHIDGMSKLREEVAFEGYAQRDPLVVYKEKAFQKFGDLMNEIGFKVIKSIFIIDKNTQIEQEKIDLEKLQLNETDLEDLINDIDPSQKSNLNPLFANPQKKPVNNLKNKDKRKKIRV